MTAENASEPKAAVPPGLRSEGACDRATREGGAQKRPEASRAEKTADVVVVGFGIAGGCAAVEAAAAGASVLVLERAAAAGGTSALAGGHFYGVQYRLVGRRLIARHVGVPHEVPVAQSAQRDAVELCFEHPLFLELPGENAQELRAVRRELHVATPEHVERHRRRETKPCARGVRVLAAAFGEMEDLVEHPHVHAESVPALRDDESVDRLLGLFVL